MNANVVERVDSPHRVDHSIITGHITIMTPTPRRSTAANRQFSEELEKGVRVLVRRDSVIRDLKRAVGIPTYLPRRDHFATLVRSILSQQISGSAAKTIIG